MSIADDTVATLSSLGSLSLDGSQPDSQPITADSREKAPEDEASDDQVEKKDERTEEEIAETRYQNIQEDLRIQAIDKGTTKIIAASEKGDIDAVKQILKGFRLGDDCEFQLINAQIQPLPGINATKVWAGATPLMTAARYGHPRLVEYLVKEGADVEMRDREYHSALMWAVITGQHECIRLFEGCDYNAVDMQGRTALMLAVIHEQEDIVKDLLWDSDVDMVDASGCTALVYACKSGQLDVVKLLCDYSADVDKVDLLRRTTLMHAARWGYLDICKTLVSRGVEVDARDKRGWTALMFAAYWNQFLCVEFLLNQGANTDIRERSTGKTALILSAEKSHLNVINALLEKECDPMIKDIYGNDAHELGVGVLVKATIKERIDMILAEQGSQADSSTPSSSDVEFEGLED